MVMGGGEYMKKLLGAALLLALVIGLSACGGGQKAADAPADKPADQGQAAAGTGADDAKKITEGKCISCHGGNLEGGAGPKLTDVGSRLSKDEIAKVLKEGRKGTMMPGGLLKDDEVEKVAVYLSNQK